MKNRVISGAVYTVLIVGLFLWRILWNVTLWNKAGFDILFAFFCGYGAFEVARATKQYALPKTYLATIITGCALPVIFFVTEIFVGMWALLIAVLTAVAVAIAFFVITLIKKYEYKQFGVSAFCIFYPFLGVIFMMTLNAIGTISEEKEIWSIIGLAFLFGVPALSDSLALYSGLLANKIKKGQAKKMCPSISPNKTWWGALGAVVGGILGGLAIYFVFSAIYADKLDLDSTGYLPLFMLVGFIASILNMFGDLFESYVKRKVDIKDMGKIMPGHGGVMDRIDGMLFVAPYILAIALIF